MILSLLGTMSNHCPSTGLHGPADLHQHDWGESSHIYPLPDRNGFQHYHLTAHTIMFKVQELKRILVSTGCCQEALGSQQLQQNRSQARLNQGHTSIQTHRPVFF